MNKLYIGFEKAIDLPKGGFLFIDDEVPEIPRARVFDPLKHCFNPLKGIDEKKARELAELLYTVYPQGENTLTVRNGRWKLAPALLQATSLDKVRGEEEVSGLIADVLFSPTLRRVLCNPTNFSFNANSVILARLNRAELGDYVALVLGLLLIAHFKGQVIVPDFGFYGRDAHVSLIRENRLIAGVRYLDELSPKLRRGVLLIEEKEGRHTTYEDAETLARYARLQPGTDGFSGFVQARVA